MKFRAWLGCAVATMAIALASALPVLAEDGILRANDPDAEINLRSRSSTQSQVLGVGYVGDRVQILGRERTSDGYTWYQVRFYNSGLTGWIRGDFVQPQGTTTPTDPTQPTQPTPTTGTVLAFQTRTYAVRLYQERTQLYLNVFNKRTGSVVETQIPASAIRTPQGATSYTAQGRYTYNIRTNETNQYVLEVYNGNQLVARERSQSTVTQPPTTGGPTLPSNCPSQAGGGSVIRRYTTQSSYIYICQGGRGSTDWRQLQYYSVPRDPNRVNEAVSLRAYLSQGSAVYAIDGAYRYDIDSRTLRVSEEGTEIYREQVLTCEGNCQ